MDFLGEKIQTTPMKAIDVQIAGVALAAVNMPQAHQMFAELFIQEKRIEGFVDLAETIHKFDIPRVYLDKKHFYQKIHILIDHLYQMLSLIHLLKEKTTIAFLFTNVHE